MEKLTTHFSYSAISSFQSCPKSYEFKYLQNKPEAFTSIETHMGRQVHEVLKWAYEEKDKGHHPELGKVLDLYQEKFWKSCDLSQIKVIKTGTTTEDYFSQGKMYIDNYYSRSFTSDKSLSLALETFFEIQLAENISYRGIIDRVARTAEGTLRIIDYKTGRTSTPTSNLQLPSYALFIFAHHPDQNLELIIEDLKQGQILAETIGRKNIAKIQEQLIREITVIIQTQQFLAQPSALCQWCGYNGICGTPHESVDPARYKQEPANSDESTHGCCPECGSELKKRNGKFGPFLGCSNFPRCRYTIDLNANGHQPMNLAAADGKDICPECGSLLKERQGKFGRFMGCSSYPQCRFTRKIE